MSGGPLEPQCYYSKISRTLSKLAQINTGDLTQARIVFLSSHDCDSTALFFSSPLFFSLFPPLSFGGGGKGNPKGDWWLRRLERTARISRSDASYPSVLPSAMKWKARSSPSIASPTSSSFISFVINSFWLNILIWYSPVSEAQEHEIDTVLMQFCLFVWAVGIGVNKL